MAGRDGAPLRNDLVVLVHGLAAGPMIMRSLAQWLGPACGGIRNWGYSSLWSPIQRHGRELAALLNRLDGHDAHERIHLVAHSMGSIIARVALAEYLPQRFGRLVMIAPPNRGSRVAARLAPYLGRIIPPLAQLTDAAESFVCSLPQPAITGLGVIAAEADFLVDEPSTRLGCECDHITLPGLHSSVLWRQETADQVRFFLENGHFQRT
jgi:triacylglycerol lipase